MLQMTVEHIAQLLDGHSVVCRDGVCVDLADGQHIPQLYGALHRSANAVVTDSRQAAPGSVFVAIAGEHVDGHNFVQSVAAAGAVAAIVDHPVCYEENDVSPIVDATAKDVTPLVQIVVKDTVQALGRLAHANIEQRRAMAHEYGPFSVIGITGSVGKTTTKDLLHSLLTTQGETVAPIGSFNNEIGLPLTALRVSERTRFLVAEMGANHMGEIRYLTSLVRPDISVVLKVGVAHVGEFGSPDNIRKAKQEIIEALDSDGVAVLNADDSRVRQMAKVAPSTVLWFSQELDNSTPQSSTVRACDIRVDGHDHASYTVQYPDGIQQQVHLALAGRHHVMNALAAATVAHYVGVSAEDIAEILQTHGAASAHRMAVSEHTFAIRNSDKHIPATIIDDSFNANPDSMRAGLQALAHWHDSDDNQQPIPMVRIAILGAMLELGENSADLHRTIGAEVAQLGIDSMISVGGAALDQLAQSFVDGAQEACKVPTSEISAHALQKHCMHVQTTDEAQQALEQELLYWHTHRPEAHIVILLKGSHASGVGALATLWEQSSVAAETPAAATSDTATDLQHIDTTEATDTTETTDTTDTTDTREGINA